MFINVLDVGTFIYTYDVNKYMAKKAKTIYLDIAKVMEWEEYCEKTGRVLSRVIELAVEKYIKENK